MVAGRLTALIILQPLKGTVSKGKRGEGNRKKGGSEVTEGEPRKEGNEGKRGKRGKWEAVESFGQNP